MVFINYYELSRFLKKLYSFLEIPFKRKINVIYVIIPIGITTSRGLIPSGDGI